MDRSLERNKCCKYCWISSISFIVILFASWLAAPLISSTLLTEILNYPPVGFLGVLLALLLAFAILLSIYYWVNQPSVSGLIWFSWRITAFVGFASTFAPFAYSSFVFDFNSNEYQINVDNGSVGVTLFLTFLFMFLFTILFMYHKRNPTQ